MVLGIVVKKRADGDQCASRRFQPAKQTKQALARRGKVEGRFSRAAGHEVIFGGPGAWSPKRGRSPWRWCHWIGQFSRHVGAAVPRSSAIGNIDRAMARMGIRATGEEPSFDARVGAKISACGNTHAPATQCALPDVSPRTFSCSRRAHRSRGAPASSSSRISRACFDTGPSPWPSTRKLAFYYYRFFSRLDTSTLPCLRDKTLFTLLPP